MGADRLRFDPFPRGRILLRLGFLLIWSGCLAVSAAASPKGQPSRDPSFREFVASLWPPAAERGVSRQTFDRAFQDISFDRRVVAEATSQAEFVQPIWDYIAAAVSSQRIERGRARAEKASAWLAKAKTTFGVDPGVLMGIWGVETDFGGFTGSDSVIQALSSLAYARCRGDYFRNELLLALVILQEGEIEPRAMRGSWAGAMGLTQFMPSSFLVYAVDFEGHGRRDIWTSEADAIGSTANYLASNGWRAGLPWGFEVKLPAGFALKDAEFVAAVSVRRLRRPRGSARRRLGAARGGGRPPAVSRGAQGPGLPDHEQLRGHQDLQPFDLLRPRGRFARRRRHRRRPPGRGLAKEGPAARRKSNSPAAGQTEAARL